MIVYELTHLFYYHSDELFYSPKKLGFFSSYESTKQAIQFFLTLPGFQENSDAFSVRTRYVTGNVVDNAFFEVIIYLHTENYSFESEVELGLYSDRDSAQNELVKYCNENKSLINSGKFVVERIINNCFLEKKEWAEGFTIEA